MLTQMIRRKPSIPPQIVHAEFGASSLLLNALFQGITRVQEFGSSFVGCLCLPWLALSSSMALSAVGD